MLGGTPETADEAIGRIVQDIKYLGERHGWEGETARILRERVLASHDEDVKAFVSALERRHPLQPWGQLLVGAGELVLAAFLTVSGLVLVVPAVLGFSSRGEFARYLADLAMGLASPTLSDPLVIALGFAFALFLLFAALYTLRLASHGLRESRLVPPAA